MGNEPTFTEHLEILGISPGEWQQLRDYLLDLGSGVSASPPAGLEGHQVVQLARAGKLNKAAKVLVGSSDSAWLALLKS